MLVGILSTVVSEDHLLFGASISCSKVLDKDDVVVALLWVKMKRRSGYSSFFYYMIYLNIICQYFNICSLYQLQMGISSFRVIVICPKLSSISIIMLQLISTFDSTNCLKLSLQKTKTLRRLGIMERTDRMKLE